MHSRRTQAQAAASPTPSDSEHWAGKSPLTPAKASLAYCVEEALRGAVRGGAVGLGVKAGLSLLLALIKRIPPRKALPQAFGADSLRFARFLAAFAALFRGAKALMALARGCEDRVNSLAAGALAGLAIALDDRERRRQVALYLACRAANVAVKRLARTGRVPYWRHAEPLLFGVANMPIMYGFLFEPEILQPGYYQWILDMGACTHEGLDITLRSGRRDPTRGMQPCYPHYHAEHSCLEYNAKDWFLGLGRAARIYVAVHVVPLVLFRHRRLLRDPLGEAGHTARALLASSAFLTTYQSIVKATQCTLRNRLGRDNSFHGPLAGLLTGLSCYLERPSRVSELMLYCMPRGIEALWRLLDSRGKAPHVPLWEVIAFSGAAAVLLASDSKDFKLTYYKGMCLLVGSDAAAMPEERQKEEPRVKQL